MDISILEDIGLSRSQIQVYLSLNEIGSTSSGRIIRKTNLQNSVVYNALNQLIEKGLVSFSFKGKRKIFCATNPENLITFIEDKKEKIKSLVNNLKKKESPFKQESQLFIGWKGVYNAFNTILKVLPKGSEYIGFAAALEEQYSKESQRFFQEFQKKRANMKYNIKLIANESAREQIDTFGYYSKFGKPKYRFVNGFAPVGLIIFGTNILQVAFDKNPIAVIINSKEMAESYRKFFYNMWKISKK
jgi:sugar-specific transcriptional regulator TrmB